MFDHIGIGVTDLAASKAFFLQALQPLCGAGHGVGRRADPARDARAGVRLAVASANPAG